jgi:hypothetical protein
LSIQAGPEFSLLVNAKVKTTTITDSYEKSDIGAALGLNYMVKNNLGFSMRYVAGFKGIAYRELYDNLGNLISKGKEGNNSLVSISILYFLKK